MNNSAIEKLNATSLINQPAVRKNSGAASATMRKYQQLALAIISVVSLMAFLFYKHEYDRLRYTLEYLEMFGNPPAEDGSSNVVCGGNIFKKINTVPSIWLKLSNNIAVYSSFWDEGNGYSEPVVRTIAVVKKSNNPNVELKSILWFESDDVSVSAVCSLEKITPRNHVSISKNNDYLIVNIICKPEYLNKKVPYMIQFKLGNEDWSPPVLIQENESWKSVANNTCSCVFSLEFPLITAKVVEFISHHNVIGIEKFTFFGPVLTPVVRKLLDKYNEESGLFYEEKSFSLPNDFNLNEDQKKIIIETDCLYRHRDSYENVIVLQLNEFIIPRNKLSLQETLRFGKKIDSTILEFHFVSQRVCLDRTHSKPVDLLLASQIRSITLIKEKGVALLRPHLTTSASNPRLAGISNQQHVPSAVASVYSFESCIGDETHTDTDHLPSNARFAELVKKSLLYRKWKIFS